MSEDTKVPSLPRHTSFGWLIAVLGGQMAADFDARLQTLDLHLGLWPTLFALWEQEGLTQAELAERCQTAGYTTTRVLDALEALGLVERRKHPTSRRAYQIFLTEKGRALEIPATDQAKACNADFLTPLTDDERTQLIALVSKVVAGRAAQ